MEQKPEVFKYDAIPHDAVVSVKISGAFYTRLQQMFFGLAQQKTEKEFKEVMERLKANDQPKDDYEFNLHTVIVLIHEVETRAKEQNLVKQFELDPSKMKNQD